MVNVFFTVQGCCTWTFSNLNFSGVSTSTEDIEDVVMKSEGGTEKKLGKKALKRINKKKNLKRLTNKKRKNQKIFKW